MPEDKTVEVRYVFKKGIVGPVKVEIKELSPEKPVELDVWSAVNFASMLAKEEKEKKK